MSKGRGCLATIFAAAAISLTVQPATPAQAPAPAQAIGQPAAPPARTPPAGYLPSGTDILRVIPPAPQKGDARDEADRRIFRETRALQGSARWAMATEDAELGSAALLRHFSCSLGIELTPLQAPRMVAMLQKATRDGAQAMLKAKDLYQRQRPYWVDEGPICRPREELGNSFDYPSGHTTAGWTWAMVLAQVAPEHAIPILLRGRAIGDSRVVCGVHNASAVEAARLLTSATMALVMATPAYQADMVEARAELAALRSQPHALPQARRCEEEARLIGIP
jgi:acid phosphatase (class A)